jgi:hypothetical protein
MKEVYMTDKTYKMRKETKIMLASILDPEYKGIFKNLFKDAESHACQARKKMAVKGMQKAETED